MKLTKSKRLNYLLGEMGIFSPMDVINHLPRRYEDYSPTLNPTPKDKERVVVEGKMAAVPKLVKHKGVSICSFPFLSNDGRYYDVVAYNRPYLQNILDLSSTYVLIGSFDAKRGKLNLINLQKGTLLESARIKPVYSLPDDYPNHLFAGLVKRSFDELEGKIYSNVPYYLRKKYRLGERETALLKVHFPKSFEDVKQGMRHLKYEEALLFSVKNILIRDETKSFDKVRKEPIGFDLAEPFLNTLPYQMTKDQVKASEEIIEDMNQPSLMYRMLQGDVGTGKTLVAFTALYVNTLRGDQGALMAPTDSLARQHYRNALDLFKGTKLKIALLVGSTPKEERTVILSDLADGLIDILIGTHALFSKDVKYSSLGLAIIDEQHRFGVNQRMLLMGKGEHADLLMMSATPIPRSLALSLFGDLEISTLVSFPSKARKVTTRIVSSDNPIIKRAIDHALEEGRNAYIIAPLIDYSEEGRMSVDSLYARFALQYKNLVGLLHGKMKQEEKEAALLAFQDRSKPILVSTSVIEVGIDVKEAALMIIYDASSFGLSSLHQLRGRVGRDGKPAFVLLTLDDDDEEKRERLETLVNTNDGFEIAETDLRLRGPGELTGMRQSGLPDFHFLNVVNDFRIFEAARNDARDIVMHQDEKGNQWILKMAKREIGDKKERLT